MEDKQSLKVFETDEYARWFKRLRDLQARLRITQRIVRLADGNMGQSRALGDGVNELKIDAGPGYRVYFTIRESVLIVLLCGGDKSTQSDDIRRAKEISKSLRLEVDG